MERPTWVTRPSIDKSTVKRAPAATWEPKRAESLLGIVGDQAPEKVRAAIMQELWARRGNEQTLGGFIKEIRTGEGLTDHR